MKKIIFFSKNDRSFSLFRKCWLIAAEKLGGKPLFWNRGIGIVNLLRSLWQYTKSHKNKRVVFGFTEILIYIPFSKKSDVFVFTGLGRLLLRDGFVRTLLKTYFSVFYRGQCVVVLNEDDKNFLTTNFSVSASVLDGEGYFFENKTALKSVGESGIHFAYVGRLLKSKRVEAILDAFSRLPSEGCRLSLYGDSDFGSLDSISDGDIEKFVSKSQNQIIQHGYCDDVKNQLLNVDIVISMSEREGLPFSVLDSIDCGCYVILSPVPGHFSFRGFPGIEFCDADGLYYCLQSTLKDKNKIKGFDRVDRIKKANEKFGYQKIVGDILSILAG